MTKVAAVETGEIVPTLQACEAVITAGLATFIEVGNALTEIANGKLYRAQGFETFEDYCYERWQFTDRRARQLMQAAEIGTIVPVENEGQARALAPIKDKPEKMAEALTKAKGNGKATAKEIAEIVAEIVEDELNAAAQVHEDRKAINDLNENAAKAGLDTDEDRQAQRGGFASTCKDIARLPRPSEFLDYQAGFLRDRHRKGAVLAHAWLTELLNLWEP